LWKQMGEPQQPASDSYEWLVLAGQLEREGSPESVNAVDGAVHRTFSQPREGLSLWRFHWERR